MSSCRKRTPRLWGWLVLRGTKLGLGRGAALELGELLDGDAELSGGECGRLRLFLLSQLASALLGARSRWILPKVCRFLATDVALDDLDDGRARRADRVA